MGQYERHRADNDQPPGEQISIRCSMPILEICAGKEQGIRRPVHPPIGSGLPIHVVASSCSHWASKFLDA